MTDHEPYSVLDTFHSGNIYVDVGDGAIHAIHDPGSDRNWRMRYTGDPTLFAGAASVIESFDRLLSHDISMKEATRRLQILRDVRRDKSIN